MLASARSCLARAAPYTSSIVEECEFGLDVSVDDGRVPVEFCRAIGTVGFLGDGVAPGLDCSDFAVIQILIVAETIAGRGSGTEDGSLLLACFPFLG